MSIHPIINLNGDSAVTLVRQQYDILNAAKALQEAMGRATPHGRNFQCNPDGDYRIVRSRFEDMCRDVERVRHVAQATMEDLLRQCDDRPGGRFAVAAEIVKEG